MIIDARSRFDARREQARHQNGRFGDQEHSEPELTLEEVFEELNEFGELDDTLNTPETDTYTGTPQEREATERRETYYDLLHRAGIDPDAVPEDVSEEIYAGIERAQENRKAQEAYRLRYPEAEDSYALPTPQNSQDAELNAAVEAIVDARGYTVAEYGLDTEYMLRWAREQQAAGTLQEALTEEVNRSRAEREETEKYSRESQDSDLGPLTHQVWDEALEEDRLRAQQQIRNLRRTNHISLKDTNQLIRNDLKVAFGNTKFSVRGDSYAGGASTRVSYVDGPPLRDAEEVAKSYAGATFDGMTDMKSYHSAAGFDHYGIPVSTSYAADFVFVTREYSEDTIHDADAFLIKAFADEGKTFDPNSHSTQYEIPQALYRLARETEDAPLSPGWMNYANDFRRVAQALIADRKWYEKNGK